MPEEFQPLLSDNDDTPATSTAERDIRQALAAYIAAWPQSSPRVSVSTYNDGNIQLFLSEPDKSHADRTHAQGEGKTLDEAAANLKKHLVKMIRQVHGKLTKDWEARVEFVNEHHNRLARAANSIAEDKPSGFVKIA